MSTFGGAALGTYSFSLPTCAASSDRLAVDIPPLPLQPLVLATYPRGFICAFSTEELFFKCLRELEAAPLHPSKWHGGSSSVAS